MSVSEGVLEYTDSDDQRKYSLYMALNPGTQNLVGLWDFNGMGADVNGDGGLDWINFDQYGYFLLQTTAGGLPELIGGYYIVDGSHHVWLVFFSVSPAHPVGDPIEYSGYLTNGSAMDLYELDALGAVITYSGIKL